MYVRCSVVYDGTDYRGFQYQPDVPTIQGELEQGLGQVAELQSRIVGAGRTDTGVHAEGQVVAVYVNWRHNAATLQRAWNAQLPPAIQVYDVREASPEFHPRFSALHRTYRYTICCTDGRSGWVRSPLTDRYTLFVRQPLDIEAMRVASRFLLGEYDFATFGQPTVGTNTVRHVFWVEWREMVKERASSLAPSLQQYEFRICANGFLRHMVRNVVGSLLEVGRGRWSAQHIGDILREKDRAFSAAPAPPQGLLFEHVEYPVHLAGLEKG